MLFGLVGMSAGMDECVEIPDSLFALGHSIVN